MDEIVTKLQKDFPGLAFVAGGAHFWSPHGQQITYQQKGADEASTGVWSLLHEVGHAALDHSQYSSDFELLQLEVAAWDKACEIAKSYGIAIDEDHVQDCLDTYRDWLHRRSTCPACGNHSLQKDIHHYQCFNCSTAWKVSASRFCRPYRLTRHPKTKTTTPV